MDERTNILITGGAGFIGSNLCERLVKTGHNVVSVDNYSTGSRSNHVPGVSYHDMHTADIFELDFKPTSIYHLGEYPRVEQSFDDIRQVWESNSTGSFEVLEFARSKKAKLIYAGSSTKFGDIGADSSPYAFTKAKNTELVKNYGIWFGLDYAITYFYNVYGKNEIADGKYATLIAKFARLAKNGKALTITSPGSQLRNFTHVDDIVDGLILVGQNGIGDGYSIGSEETYSVLDIAKMFGGEIEMMAHRAGNRMEATLSTYKTQSLGWSAKRNVRGYIKTIMETV